MQKNKMALQIAVKRRHLLLGRKVMTDLDSVLKSRDISLPTKVRLVKAMVFSVVNAKKYRKTKDWERLKISSRKLEIPREHFMQRWAR